MLSVLTLLFVVSLPIILCVSIGIGIIAVIGAFIEIFTMEKHK
jgi:hypothetical protein